MKLTDIGYGNLINAGRIVAVIGADSAPAKRLVSAAKEKCLAIDATCGKKTKTVIVMDSGHVVMSAKTAEAIENSTESGQEENNG